MQCLDVHPSFFAITKRVKFTEDFKHQIAYSDLSETDSYQTFFVMSFLNLCSCHGKKHWRIVPNLMKLAVVSEPGGGILVDVAG